MNMTNKYRSGQEAYDSPRNPTVDHPDYYQSNGIEVIDVIEHFGLGFRRGSCIKYLLRAGRKPGADMITDLRKAQWYLSREIEELEKRGKTNENHQT